MPGKPDHQAVLARPDARRVQKSAAVFRNLFHPVQRRLYHRRWLPKDKDGYYQITGRVDDVINVSGHRMGTAEVESALVSHPSVAESAVVGYPHPVKGQSIYAFVTLNSGVEKNDALEKRAGGPRPQGNWAHRHTGDDSMVRFSAQNAFRKNHATLYSRKLPPAISARKPWATHRHWPIPAPWNWP